MRGRLVLTVAAAVLTVAGCQSSPTSPSADPVRVTVTQAPTVSGDSLVFTMLVENITQATVDLTFSSGCDLLPYFTDARTGRDVTPGWGCTAVFVQKPLRPGEIITGAVTVKADTVPGSTRVVLPAGDYTIHARLEDQKYRTESDRVAFSLR